MYFPIIYCLAYPTMEEVASKRGKPKCMYEGFIYIFDKLSANGNKKFWRCEFKNECKARLHTTLDHSRVIDVRNQHSHGSDAAHLATAKILQTIKLRAENTVEIPSVIINSALQGTSAAIQAQIPNRDAVRKIIQRRRNELNAAPPQPSSRAELLIPEAYQTYEISPGISEQFLLFDSGVNDENRILIVGRQSSGSWSSLMKKLYVDGTFSLAPNLFAQIYVIMAERGGFVVPVLYALLPNKNNQTYIRMFEAIKQMWPQLNPISISIDFEQAAIGAVKTVFPECAIFGCMFHLTKNLRKKLSNEGLLNRYNTDAEFALAARMVISLSFVPIPDLDDALEALTIELHDDLAPILNWFEDYYVGRINRNRTRRAATFPPDTWNVYQRTINGENRTNNHAEAAHRRMQAEFGVDHPTIWKFIDGIRGIQKGRDTMYEQFIRGDQPPMKRQKYIAADERIMRIVDSYEARNIIEYVRGLAHNFLMQ